MTPETGFATFVVVLFTCLIVLCFLARHSDIRHEKREGLAGRESARLAREAQPDEVWECLTLREFLAAKFGEVWDCPSLMEQLRRTEKTAKRAERAADRAADNTEKPYDDGGTCAGYGW